MNAGKSYVRDRTSDVKKAWSQLASNERAAALTWTSFTSTFAITRGITHLIKSASDGSGGGVRVGGKHLHHYNIGIALLSGLAGAAMITDRLDWKGPTGPVLYGVANALIADEAALLLDLQDVYWGPKAGSASTSP